MADKGHPQIYSIAAHRGFADALAAGIIARYGSNPLDLARLTLLVPSARARRSFSDAFIRQYGELGQTGILMPRMAAIGDLDLDEALGALLDPLGSDDIPSAVDPTYRWLRLADLLTEELGDKAPNGAVRLRMAREITATMDRLLIEGIGPEMLVGDQVQDLLGDLAAHWQVSLRTFARMQARWLVELEALGQVDSATRRNLLFEHAAQEWKANPPTAPVIAAGVTSSSPALAQLLRAVSELPQGLVVLPDFDLAMDDTVWDELGDAGGDSGRPFQPGDAVTHPQYHLKLLLNRMGIARAEVKQWHSKGMTASPPERSHAISNLFLPPEASKEWVGLPADKRRLSGVRICECSGPEEEAQLIALLVREAIEVPERRVAVVTPDRSLARRVVQQLRRWNIDADDSAGRPLSQSLAGRFFLLLAEVAGEQAAPVSLIGLLEHPLVRMGDDRGHWLAQVRAFELRLRGPRHAPGLTALAEIAAKAQVGEAKLGEWWNEVSEILTPLVSGEEGFDLADLLDRMIVAAEALCGTGIWGQEDGRSLSAFVDQLRLQARQCPTRLDRADIHIALSEAMEGEAVRLPYGGHPRVAIYGLLESRMTRANLVICGGLVEGVWPARDSVDPLLAPPVLRALGVPGADFRTGLAAHDLAGALGAPEVVLTRADRDAAGPVIPSRFLLRVKALLGAKLTEAHRESAMLDIARALDDAPSAPLYLVPQPMPNAAQRRRDISVTQLDKLRSDPYQFYASKILGLNELDALDAEPSPAWQGNLAHNILEDWHKGKGTLEELADQHLTEMNAHLVLRTLWRPRLLKALEWVELEIANCEGRKPALFEEWGEMNVRGIRIFGKADRIDRLDGGELAIVDYKTGKPPSGSAVAEGYALQLGTTGLMAKAGAFGSLSGTASAFEYWSLGKNEKSETGFGYITTPLLVGSKRTGIAPEDFLPEAERFLNEALDDWILGEEPFTARLNPDAPGYATYDQLMRLDEWMGRET